VKKLQLSQDLIELSPYFPVQFLLRHGVVCVVQRWKLLSHIVDP